MEDVQWVKEEIMQIVKSSQDKKWSKIDKKVKRSEEERIYPAVTSHFLCL